MNDCIFTPDNYLLDKQSQGNTKSECMVFLKFSNSFNSFKPSLLCIHKERNAKVMVECENLVDELQMFPFMTH